MVEELMTWLRATIQGDLAAARAAAQGDWEAYGHGDDDYLPYPAYPGEDTTRGHGWNVSVTDLAGPDVAAEFWHVDALHIVAQQSRHTIARCEAELAELDALHAAPHYAWDDRPEYSCPMLDPDAWDNPTCTCGRDALVDRLTRIKAYSYRYRPEWKEGWAP